MLNWPCGGSPAKISPGAALDISFRRATNERQLERNATVSFGSEADIAHYAVRSTAYFVAANPTATRAPER